MKYKVSVITPTYNVEKTISETLNSIKNQTYTDIEHVIVDGNSNDETINIIKNYIKYNYVNSKIIIEEDKGLYDAINKGINIATGDIIGILNADDTFYNNNVIEDVVKRFQLEKNLDAIYGNIIFISNHNPDKSIRNYNSKNWNPNKFAWGIMPPHPSFFCKKLIYLELGLYKINYKIAADYELLIRYLFINKINVKYTDMITTKMRMGGISTSGFKSVLLLNKEILRACKENHISTNYFKLYLKYFIKIFEYI
jgi:glycosyltransferase involved in cell wall biosynthesis